MMMLMTDDDDGVGGAGQGEMSRGGQTHGEGAGPLVNTHHQVVCLPLPRRLTHRGESTVIGEVSRR